MKRRALFLDRDGVINVDHGYVHRPEDFEFIDGIFDLCRHARELGYLIVVVTNQAGIGRGFYTEVAFHALTAWMKQQFADQGVDIAAVYFCPHHALHGIGGYKRECERRKPNPGMLKDAAREHGIDLGASMLIGDKESDIEAGRRAGLALTVHFGKAANTRATAIVTTHADSLAALTGFAGRAIAGHNSRLPRDPAPFGTDYQTENAKREH